MSNTITKHQLVRVNIPGDDEASHPAIVVAVDEKAATATVHVFRDGPGTQYLGPLPFFPSEAAARGDLVDPATVSPSAYVVWPDPSTVDSRVSVLESKLSSLQSQYANLQSQLSDLAAAKLSAEASCVGGVLADDVTGAAAAASSPATA